MICVYSFPQAMVVTDDKNFYIFSNKYFWTVDFYPDENRFFVNNSTAKLIADNWENLPQDISLGFTVQGSSFGNLIAGHTIFVKLSRNQDEDQYFRYHNMKFEKKGSLKYWNVGKELWHEWRYVMTVRNSSLVLLNSAAELLTSTAKGKSYVFDNADYPG